MAEKNIKLNEFVKEFTDLLYKHNVTVTIHSETIPEGQDLEREVIADVSFISASKSTVHFTQSLADMRRRVFQHANKAVAAKGRLRGFKIGTSTVATVIKHDIYDEDGKLKKEGDKNKWKNI